MNLWHGIAVCLPTVPARQSALAATLRQWRAIGVEPIVETQTPGIVPGHVAQRATAERALWRALARDPAHVLFTEDDVDLAPELPGWMPQLTALDEAVTLWVTGRAHYPAAIQRALVAGDPLPRQLVPLRNQRAWYGTLAVLLPADLVRATLAWPSERYGWDAHLGAFLVAHDLPLFVSVPNLVQHRGLRSVANPRGGRQRSLTFGWPVAS